MQSWSIIIFCYNEAGNVGNVVQKCISALKIIAPEHRELIIVDDGSSDESVLEIEREILKFPGENIRLIKHSVNLGIGMALRSGYDNVKNENVCAVPADGQFDINELLPFSFVEPNSFVSFYRKENQSYSLFRNVLSLVNRKFNKWMLGIDFKDINWVKIYKSDALKKLDLQLKSSLVETEICAKLVILGKNFVEVESTYLPRNKGVSKGASWKIINKAASEMLKVYRAVKAFKRKIISE